MHSNTPDIGQLIESCDVPGPASEVKISRAEEALNVRFPPAYRAFLAKYGAAMGLGFEVAGLFPHPNPEETPYWIDVVTLNRQLHRAARGGIPASYIAIADDGGDFTFYLDTGSPSPECPVVVLGPGAEGVVVANNFNDFFIAFANDALKY